MGAIHWTEAEFEAALSSGQLLAVDFWAAWCGPCKMLAPVIDQLAERYEGKALVGKVNVDEESGLAARYGVMSIPTVIYFKDGKELHRSVGALPLAQLAAPLEKNL